MKAISLEDIGLKIDIPEEFTQLRNSYNELQNQNRNLKKHLKMFRIIGVITVAAIAIYIYKRTKRNENNNHSK